MTADVPLGLVVALSLVAGVAGFVDAIAGGGGLLSLPSLLAAGLPPHLALGTNKAQGMFGSGAAVFRYAREGWIDARRARWTFPLGALGSLAGGGLVLLLDPGALRVLVIVLLCFAAVFLAFRRPKPATETTTTAKHPLLAAGVIAVTLGAYDGFFGPGTGTFLVILLVAALGLTLEKATGEAKVVNFASNVASMVLFASKGLILWKIALPMAAAQLLGAYLGAHTAVKGGARLIRFVVLGVVAALVAKLSYDVAMR